MKTLTEDELSSALIIIPTGDYVEGMKALKTNGNGNCLYNSVSVLIQGDESANLIHNKRVIYMTVLHFKLNLLTAFVNDNFAILSY